MWTPSTVLAYLVSGTSTSAHPRGGAACSRPSWRSHVIRVSTEPVGLASGLPLVGDDSSFRVVMRMRRLALIGSIVGMLVPSAPPALALPSQQPDRTWMVNGPVR